MNGTATLRFASAPLDHRLEAGDGKTMRRHAQTGLRSPQPPLRAHTSPCPIGPIPAAYRLANLTPSSAMAAASIVCDTWLVTNSLNSASAQDGRPTMTTIETATGDQGIASSPRPQLCGMALAVLIPCYNEALTIAKVVRDFHDALPDALIFVYDNRSTDNTAEEARLAGAVVRSEAWPGKGNVVRRMFADVDADLYVMVDGDGTYDVAATPRMVDRCLADHLDMVVGTRLGVYANAHRPGHALGNRVFNGLYRNMFGPLFSDIFSGYRVFSRRFVKSFPAISSGFEIEAEMSVHASQLRMPIAEIPTPYGAREEGSQSKLRTFQDAFLILRTLVLLFKEVRPARFYGIIALALSTSSVVISFPLLFTYLATGLVPRFPTAILATGLMILAALSLFAGLVLDSVARGRLEQKRLVYLTMPQLRPRQR